MSEALGAAIPAEVANPELVLSRVTIMPGAAIPVHYHPGTQIGAIVQGVLTYEVLSGSVKLYRSGADPAAPEVVSAGQTVLVLPGDVLVETPGEVHQGRNEGDVPVVIYLSSLFPAGSPRSIIVEATPAG
jgi:quercetin dioxygenase-like cupin family protein